MSSVVITIQCEVDGKLVAFDKTAFSPTATNFSLEQPIQPVVLQEAEYSHDDEMILHGYKVTVNGVLTNRRVAGQLATYPQQGDDLSRLPHPHTTQ